MMLSSNTYRELIHGAWGNVTRGSRGFLHANERGVGNFIACNKIDSTYKIESELRIIKHNRRQNPVDLHRRKMMLCRRTRVLLYGFLHTYKVLTPGAALSLQTAFYVRRNDYFSNDYLQRTENFQTVKLLLLEPNFNRPRAINYSLLLSQYHVIVIYRNFIVENTKLIY